jgi:hyperosmotically inducible periplasmic protein
MSFRLTALLCLTGAVAACSENSSRPANDPSYATQSAPTTEVATDTRMTPASLEQSKAPGPTTPTPSTNEAPSDTRAPLVADTKGAAPNAFKADPPPANAATSEPLRPTEAGKQPDNTKVNERDRSTAALTPPDQRENQSDLKITQQIRQAVMGNGSLSFTAKNVKIITQGGKVTLRGPVNSADERSAIEAAARQVAGVSQVDNQIEVKK